MTGLQQVDPPRPIAIVGPTASGKTALAIEVARRVDGEIISLDSRQAYAGFQVGTAAPTAEEQDAATHHGVGFLEPDERYGAGRFGRRAAEWFEYIRARGHVPILAGGTGLFLRTLTHPMFEEPAIDSERRTRLSAWQSTVAGDEVRRWAERLDPPGADGEQRDRQRAERTIELALLTGAPLSWWITNGEPARPALRMSIFVLEVPAQELRARIRARTSRMLSGAWQQEVADLLADGLEGTRAFDAVGYRDVADLVRGEIDRSEVEDRVFKDTWQYARRQRTWFRHQLPTDAEILDGSGPPEQLARHIVEAWRNTGANMIEAV